MFVMRLAISYIGEHDIERHKVQIQEEVKQKI